MPFHAAAGALGVIPHFHARVRDQLRLRMHRMRSRCQRRALYGHLNRRRIPFRNEFCKITSDGFQFIDATDIAKNVIRYASRANDRPSELPGNRGNGIRIPTGAYRPR